ncbi:hypothetical protein FRC12_013248 [Ceratobasidium sp. 428]|nr:hypothetical protein FRC12_013248 [Ceratobasidium sp. 428]
MNGNREVTSDEQADKPVEEGYRIECEDEQSFAVSDFLGPQTANIRCETCEDDFYDVCFQAQHRKGTRQRHASRPLHELADNIRPTSKTNESNVVSEKQNEEMTDADADDGKSNTDAPTSPPTAATQS